MFFQSGQLFSEWVKQEISHFHQQKKLNQAPSLLHQWNEQWAQLIDMGIVQKWFQQIDQPYFRTIFSHIDPKSAQSKFEVILRQYWMQLDKYLQFGQNKRINPTYLGAQTSLKKQLTSREYSRASNSSLEGSTMELVKLLFYLLVQKNNNGRGSEGNEGDQKFARQMQQTMLCSVANSLYGYDQQEGKWSNKSPVQRGLGESVLTEEGNSVISGSQTLNNQTFDSINGLKYDQNPSASHPFLERICSLSQQVQQHLVAIVQSIQQREIIQPLHFLPHSQSHQNLSESFLYLSQPNPSLTSDDNFKKLIYKQIEQVSEENQDLKQKMQQIIEENLKLQKQLEDNQEEETQLVSKINAYAYEKQQLFQYLNHQHSINVNSLEEFIQIVEHIQHENQLLENTIAQIQERNYEIETQNAQKIHSINKNALEITQVNEDITKVKCKIVDLKQDIEYLDEFVNGNQSMISAELIKSIRVGEFLDEQQGDHVLEDDEIYEGGEGESSFVFNKSIDLDARHSFGHVLRENHDIFNEKVSKTNSKPTHNRVLTDSITGYGQNRSSFNVSQKLSTHKKNRKSSFPLKDQQNIDPTPFQEDELKLQHFPHCHSKTNSHASLSYEIREQERQIEEEKEKYKQELVNNLQKLYKQINDLTKEVTQAKEENKVLEKKNKRNERKISQLKCLHDAFLKQAKRV